MLLLDSGEGVGGVDDGDKVEVLEVSKMLIAGYDEFGVCGKRGAEHDPHDFVLRSARRSAR